jgi:hypothetical protein
MSMYTMFEYYPVTKVTQEVDVMALPVIAMKIDGGIIIATNPIARYGTSLRYTDVDRV